MHPELTRFIERFHKETQRTGQYRKSIGKYERIFLEKVWGPAFQHNFDGLHAEYPFKDFKGGDRFIDFVYIKGGIRLLIEIDGYTTHARDISPGEFDDHLTRQNDLVLSGWFILRFSAHQIEKRETVCQRQIIQAIGHWWTSNHGLFCAEEGQLWPLRKKLIIQLALRQEGIVRAADVSREFRISNRTAINWLARFSKEGILEPFRIKERITGYKLVNYTEYYR